MKKLILLLAALILLNSLACAEGQLAWRFTDADEGAQLLRGNAAYCEGFNDADLAYRLQKNGGTVDEWLELAAGQTRDFSPEEQRCVAQAFSIIEGLLTKGNLTLPPLEEILLVKTTAAEECGADAYTHKNQIYLSEELLEIAASGEGGLLYFTHVLMHELFHCITRANPDFRAEAYALIGFDVQAEEFEIAPALRQRVISNPDVARHDSSAVFTIGGETTECFIVFAAEPWEAPGDSFFVRGGAALVPVARPEESYPVEAASDFWDVVGRNTTYVLDPEECMADNFSLALQLAGGFITPEQLPSPEIPEGLIALMAD